MSTPNSTGEAAQPGIDAAEPSAPLLRGLLAPAGAPVARTVQQGPPRRSSLTSVAADVTAVPASPEGGPVGPAQPPATPAGKKPFQTYQILDMKSVLNDPATVCARTQMELRGMDRSPKQLQLRVSESLQVGLKAYCEDTNVQQRALVEALLRAFLAEIGRPVQD